MDSGAGPNPKLSPEDLKVLAAASAWHFSPPTTADGNPRELTEAELLPVHPSLANDLNAYLTATPAAREVVRTRLPILARARHDDTRGAVTRAAQELGTPRANVYRLLERMIEMGPVRGLLPHERRERSPSLARNGLDETAERLMAELLALEPSASIAKVERHLRDEIGRLNEAGSGIDVPSSSAIKRRLHHLRGMAVGGTAEGVTVGSRILLDHCRLNIDVELDPPVEGMPRYAAMTIAVDEDTKLVIGFGLFLNQARSGLSSLLRDAETRLPVLAEAGAPMATRLRELRWVVPPDLDANCERVGRDLPASRRPLIEPIRHGERRGGSRLVTLMGDHIGDLMLLTRPADMSPLTRAHVRLMFNVMGLENATFTVAQAIDRWNARLLEGMGAKGRANAAGREDATLMSADLLTLFEPVLS